MGISLATIKRVVTEAQMRVEALASERLRYALAPVYEMALSSVYTFVTESDDPPSGWVRVAALLTNMRQRLLIDALGAAPLEQLQARVRSLLDLPEIITIEALDDIHFAIRTAISIGAPRYNSGDIQGCCTVYWATMQAILLAPAPRGFNGYARALGSLRNAIEGDPPTAPFDSQGTDDFAWELRDAFDAALRVTG